MEPDPKDMPFGPAPEPDDDEDVGELPRDPETGVPLFRGRPINEVLRSDPEVFEIAVQSLHRALDKALNVGTTRTHNEAMDWDKLETQGPDDICESLGGEDHDNSDKDA